MRIERFLAAGESCVCRYLLRIAGLVVQSTRLQSPNKGRRIEGQIRKKFDQEETDRKVPTIAFYQICILTYGAVPILVTKTNSTNADKPTKKSAARRNDGVD